MSVHWPSAIEWIEQENDRLLGKLADSKSVAIVDEIRSFRSYCKLLAAYAEEHRTSERQALELFDLARDRNWYWSRREDIELGLGCRPAVVASESLPEDLIEYTQAACSQGGLEEASSEDDLLSELASDDPFAALQRLADNPGPPIKLRLARYLQNNPSPPIGIAVAAYLTKLATGLMKVRIASQQVFSAHRVQPRTEAPSWRFAVRVESPRESWDTSFAGGSISLERMCIRRTID